MKLTSFILLLSVLTCLKHISDTLTANYLQGVKRTKFDFIFGDEKIHFYINYNTFKSDLNNYFKSIEGSNPYIKYTEIVEIGFRIQQKGLGKCLKISMYIYSKYDDNENVSIK
jgi:hypothetical protein